MTAAAATGIWTHGAQAGQAAQTAGPRATAADSSTDGSGSSSGDSAIISANDFLTLLVTEMQNQDPTSATDPNEYINQLVNVNSLEQLISINQTLSGALGTTNPSTSGASGGSQQGPATQAASAAAAHLSAGAAPTTTHTGGNLGVPSPNPAAQRVAHALTEKH